jgi:predicted peptidase
LNLKNLVLFTRVGYYGQEIYAVRVPAKKKIQLSDISISGNVLDTAIDRKLADSTGRTVGGVKGIKLVKDTAYIELAPFPIACKFTINVGNEKYTTDNVEKVLTQTADSFEAMDENGVHYRLYRPSSESSRPLILFLHGGGECGDDNSRQLLNCFGAVKLAESYPDVYVMAPQVPDSLNLMKTGSKILLPPKQSFSQSGDFADTGWTRPYLASICDIIRKMISDGKVNPSRIYVTGMSMGGAGVLRAMSVATDLFAAALPICPTMTPETFKILCSLTGSKIWITCSYVDHTVYRHKYITDGILSLRDSGNKDAHLTIFSPEDLAEYGIGTIDDMPLEQKIGWNHLCWVPTYCNSNGALAWLITQKKE